MNYSDPKYHYLDRESKRKWKRLGIGKKSSSDENIQSLSNFILREYFYSPFSWTEDKSRLNKKLDRGKIFRRMRNSNINCSVKELMLDIDKYRSEIGEISKKDQEKIELYIQSIIKSLIREWEINKLES